MRREEAEAEREKLQRSDHEHTYVVRERPVGEWEVLRINVPPPTSHVVVKRGEPADVPEDLRPSSIRQISPYGPGF